MVQAGRWRDRPNVVPWPPLIFAGAVLAAVVLDHVRPLGTDLPMPGALRVAGAIAMVIGIGFDSAAMVTMRRARANILPHRAATALVTSGPFAMSRNPIYLGNTLLVAGAAPVFANPWFVPAAVVAAVLVWAFAIRREEIHMAVRFGADWTAYAGRTPRWAGLLPSWRRRPD